MKFIYFLQKNVKNNFLDFFMDFKWKDLIESTNLIEILRDLKNQDQQK